MTSATSKMGLGPQARRGWATWLALTAAAWTFGCSDLTPIEPGCGNHVVEPGERCDGPSRAGFSCREPGQPSACQFDCRGDLTCPPELGCGHVDGVCRRASGNLGAAGESVAGLTFGVGTDDVDGDQVLDAVAFTSSALEIGFIGADGFVQQSLAIPALFAAPAVADLTGDGAPDLVMPSLAGPDLVGLGVFLGKSGRILEPQSYYLPYGDATDVVDILLVPFQSLWGSGLDLAAGFSPNGVYVSDVSDDAFETIAEVETTPDEVAAIAVGDVDARVVSPCHELVLARRGASQLEVVYPCRWDDSQAPAAPVTNVLGDNHVAHGVVTLLPGTIVREGLGSFGDAIIQTGMVLTDLPPFDGHLDLLIATRAGDEAGLQIAWGLGDGQFHSSPPPTADPDMHTASFGPLPMWGSCSEESIDTIWDSQLENFPLAASDLNGDLVVDFVLPDGIYVSHDYGPAGMRWRPSTCALGGEWLEAVIGDLNGDGRADVVASSRQTAQADLLMNDGSGVFTLRGLPADGPVERLRVADFDGDLADDIAFKVVSTTLVNENGEPFDSLYVAYGNVGGAAEPPTLIASQPSLHQLVAGRFSGWDSADDLLAASLRGEEAALAFFRGSPARILQSPYFLTDAFGIPLWPIVVDSGRFGADRATLAVVAGLADINGDFSLVVVEVAADALARLSPSTAVGLGETVGFFSAYDLRAATADLDGDGVDELVVMTRTVLTELVYDGSGFVISRQTELPEPFAFADNIDLRLPDLDGDGAPDALLLSQSGAVMVVWNDGGSLDLLGATEVVPAHELSDAGEGAPILTATAIELGGEPGLELVLTDEASAYLVPQSGRVFGAPEPFGPMDGGHAAAAGDVTGDGVDDLLLASGSALRLFVGKADD